MPTPVLWPSYETEILYWSNFLQLIFLPAITVGTVILNRDSEARALEDHKIIRREFGLLQEAHSMLRKSLQEIAGGVHELVQRSEHDENAALQAKTNEGSPTVKKTSES